jgi:hypothetical protein
VGTKLLRKCDAAGNFREDVLVPTNAEGAYTMPSESGCTFVDTSSPQGLYQPRWDGKAWVEGATDGANRKASDADKAAQIAADLKVVMTPSTNLTVSRAEIEAIKRVLTLTLGAYAPAAPTSPTTPPVGRG